MNEWQPIETAPKDGTKILIACDWDDVIVVGEWKDSEWVVSWDHHPLDEGFEADKWMPLPPR